MKSHPKVQNGKFFCYFHNCLWKEEVDEEDPSKNKESGRMEVFLEINQRKINKDIFIWFSFDASWIIDHDFIN